MTENFGEVVHDGFNVEISSIEMKDLGLNEFSRFQKKFSSIVDDPIRLFSSVGGRYEIENIMKELINPLVKKFSLRYQNLIDDPKQSLEGLRKFHRFIYLSTYYSLPNWDPSKIDSVDNFIDLLFEENFVKKFDQTEKKKGSKAITNIFTQSIEHASLIYLFEKVKARFNIPKNEPLTGPDFIKMIRDFRKNTDKNQFFSDFLRKYLPYVFFKYGESFCTGTKSLYMQFDNNPSTQIGWHAENAAYFTIFPFFELISLIENNYDLKTVEVLKYYTYNPYGRDNKIQTSDMERVLDGKDAKDIFDKINNYKNLFGKFSNWAEMDLSTISREGESLSNWEVKNSKDSGSTYLMNILIDSFRSIYLATSRSVAIEKVDIEKAKEHLVLAIDVDDKQSLKSIITDRLVSLKRPQDLANQPQRNYEKRKYSKYLELLGRLCEEINKLINTNDIDIFYENLILLFQTKNFRKNINEITKEIFGKSNSQKEKEKIDLLKNIFEIESLTRWLKSGKINPILPRFTNFLIKDSNDKLKFNFGAFFNVYLKTEKLVNEDIFINPQISFFFIGGILKESQDLTEREKERILSGNLAIVHNSKKKNGIMLVDKPSMKLEGTDKDGKSVQIEDGFTATLRGLLGVYSLVNLDIYCVDL